LGGRGSGRPASFGLLVDKCHELHSIDLAWLRRRNLLTPGRWSTITWSRGGHTTGSIRLTPVPGGLLLSYRHRSAGDDWRDVSETIPVLQTPGRFGGHRHWFSCPGCDRRCRILYGGAQFRCRTCQRLRYESQYEPALARAASKALKIRRRLGCSGGLADPFPEKPKGMHWRTYERLRSDDIDLQNSWVAGIAHRFDIKPQSED